MSYRTEEHYPVEHCARCGDSGIIDRGPSEEREACECANPPEPFTFEWLGSQDHYDCDHNGENFVEDYCCEEGDYAIQVVGGVTFLYDQYGDIVYEPCENLQRMVALFENTDDPNNPAAAQNYGLVICRHCGGYYAVGDKPSKNGNHKPFIQVDAA